MRKDASNLKTWRLLCGDAMEGSSVARNGRSRREWQLAGQAAMFLSRGTARCYSSFEEKTLYKMPHYLARRVQARENIEILYQTEIRKMLAGKSSKKSSWKIRRTANAERFERRRFFP